MDYILVIMTILFNEKDITKQSSIYIDKLGEYAYITIKNFQGLKLLENKDVSILEIDAPITNKITKITTIHKMSYKFYKHHKECGLKSLLHKSLNVFLTVNLKNYSDPIECLFYKNS